MMTIGCFVAGFWAGSAVVFLLMLLATFRSGGGDRD